MNKKGAKGLFSGGKIWEILFLCALAMMLVIASWKVFQRPNETNSGGVVTATSTEMERKVCRILEQIEGVGTADVMICETEDGIKSVVVVCNGGDDLQTIMTVREAVAAALGMEQKAIKIYQKK